MEQRRPIWRRPGPPDRPTHPLRDSVFMLGAASAFVYLVGFLYFTAYYHRLGIPESEIPFDSGQLRTTSLLALAMPVFLIAGIAILTMMFGPRDGPLLGRNPFHPVPALRVIVTVYSLYFAKLYADLQYGADATIWWFWSRRDVVFCFIGILLLAAQYWFALKPTRPLLHKFLAPRTSKNLNWFIAYSVISVLLLQVQGEWPMPWWATVLFALGWLFLVATVIHDVVTRSKREPIPERTRGPIVQHPSERLLWIVWMSIIIMLSASFSGLVAAEELLDGCHAATTIVIDPLPESLNASHTFWLLLHRDATYYVRDTNTSAVHAVTIAAPTTATLLRGGASGAC